MKFSFATSICAAALSLTAMSAAQASVIFTITEQSNKQATITASGTLDGAAVSSNGHIIVFDGLLTGVTGSENITAMGLGSTMAIGSNMLSYTYTADAARGLSPAGNSVIYAFDSSYNAYNVGDAVTGSLVLDLSRSSGIFAPVNTVGNVIWGIGGNAHTIGTYSVVGPNAVPEPGSLALIGFGLLAVGAARRSRRRI